MQRHEPIMGRFASLCLCIVLLSGGAVVAAEEKLWYESWFEPALDASSIAGYEIKSVELQWTTARCYQHHPAKGERLRSKKILAMLPKESSSYPKAFSRFLQHMAMKFPGSQITLFDWAKDTEKAMKILAWAQAEKADLIFTLGSESATLAGQRYVNCGIPIVTCNNKDPVLLGLLKDRTSGSGTNIAYTTVNMPVEELFRSLLRFRPSLKTVSLAYWDKHEEVKKTEVEPLRELFSNKGIRCIDIDVKNEETTKEELDTLIPAALAAMRAEDPDLQSSIILVTSCSNLWEQPMMGHIASLAGKCPVLATVPDAASGREAGAIMAIGQDRGTAALLASVYATRILSGESKPQDMPLGFVTPPDIAINFYKAREIGVAIPFDVLENGNFIYGYDGKLVMRAESGKNQPVESPVQ